VDFADAKTIMTGMGMALMGTGIAEGEHRAIEAAQRAISSPLLEDASIHGARCVLINVTGGEDMTLHEVSEAAQCVQEASDPDANIIFGTVIDPNMHGRIKVTVIATGFSKEESRLSSRSVSGRGAARAGTEPAAQPALRRSAEFLRRGSELFGELDGAEGEMEPNFGRMKDDLDVPAFLRKQMD